MYTYRNGRLMLALIFASLLSTALLVAGCGGGESSFPGGVASAGGGTTGTGSTNGGTTGTGTGNGGTTGGTSRGSLVYVHYIRSTPQIFRRNLTTGNETQVSNLSAALNSLGSLALANDNTQLLYIRQDTSGIPQIYATNLATGAETQITNGSANIQSLAYAPDGIRVAFNRGSGFNSQIYIRNLQTGAETSLDTTNAALTLPNGGSRPSAYSPDGGTLYFVGFPTNANETAQVGNVLNQIYAYNLATGVETQITTDTSLKSYQIQVSSDGKTLVYSREPSNGGTPQVVTHVIATGAETAITTDAAGGSDPTFTPDGGTIIFARQVNNYRHLFAHVLATGAESQYLTTTDETTSPRFAPNLN